jgi:curved DNA-binding protein CbpA
VKARRVSARSDPRGYYRVLGVPRTASADEIRLAFRARAMETHPDQGGERADGETFRLIREAYDVLRDPRRRMAYDASGLAAWEFPPEQGGRGAGAGWPSAEAAGAAREQPVDGEAAAGVGASDGVRGDAASGGTGWTAGASHGGANGEARRDAPNRRRRRASPTDSSRLWPLVAAGLALLLLVALGSLWSAHRQLDDRQGIVAELYDRLARLGEDHAELRTRYRSIAFLDLERALRQGGSSSSGLVPMDLGRAAYRFDLAFAEGAVELGEAATQGLARALVEIAQRIDRLPAGADWLIVLEAQAARAAFADQVAVDAWEPALLRLATVLDHVLAQGLPAERFAIRFNAGFAPPSAMPEATTAPAAATPHRSLESVSIQLLCCAD